MTSLGRGGDEVTARSVPVLVRASCDGPAESGNSGVGRRDGP